MRSSSEGPGNSPSENSSPEQTSSSRLASLGSSSIHASSFDRKVGVAEPDSASGDQYSTRTFEGAEAIEEEPAGDGDATTYDRGLGNQLLSRQEGNSSPSTYHHDRLGSVSAVSGQDGNLEALYRYGAFGNVLVSEGSSENSYGYLGNEYATDGLWDFHARHYDPSLGRFYSEDPLKGSITDPQSQNAYAYGLGGPLRYVDPDGLKAMNASGGGGSYYLSSDEKSGPTAPTDATSTEPWISLENVSNAAAGFGDSASFGLSEWAREQLGSDHVVDKDSGAYKGGELSSFAAAPSGKIRGGSQAIKHGSKAFNNRPKFRMDTLRKAWNKAEDGPKGGVLS